MKSAKTMGTTPKAIAFDDREHNHQQIDAMLLVTRTDTIPLVFGSGDQTPGQIIDEMIRDGNMSKVTLDLDRNNF